MYLKIEQEEPLSEEQRKILTQIKSAPQPVRGQRYRGLSDPWPWSFWIEGVIVRNDGRIYLDCYEFNRHPSARHPGVWRKVGHITPSDHHLEGVDEPCDSPLRRAPRFRRW